MAWLLLGAPAMLVVAMSIGLAVRADPASASGTGPALQTLHGRQGQVPPGATRLGPAPSSTVLPLTVTLQPRDPDGLAAEAAAVSDLGSPEYHHFLTPRQFAQRYGPTAATTAQVENTLRDAGLTVGAPSSTGLSLPVSGNVAQVQSAFSTPIDRYKLSSGKTGYDNRFAPKLPATVAPQVQGVIGLDTLSPPRPTSTLPIAAAAGGRGASAAATGAAGPAPALAPGQPSPVSSGGCAASINSVQSMFGALDAPQLAQAYSFGSLYSAGDYGAGTTVALAELAGAGYSSSDITQFAQCYGITLSPGQVSPVVVNGGGATGGGTVEAELDIDTVLSMAPQANIQVYEGGVSADLYDVLSRIVSDDTAKIVSASWTNGCEAYVGSAMQNAENTLLQAAAVDGQSVFVAAGDQGSEGCNVNGVISAPTGTAPVAQAVDSGTGTLYVANRTSNTLSVDGEGTTSNPSNFSAASSVRTGSAPDAVALAPGVGKVFVANGTSNSLTSILTATCNQSTTSGCASPTQIGSGGHLSGPSALAVNGSTLYVGNANGTVAVYGAGTNAFVASVTLPSGSVPSALAVDPANGFAYVADGANNRVDYFNASACNATVTSGCSATPLTVAVGQNPIGLAVDDAVGSLYVANAGTGGGVSVVSLTSQAVTATISTGQPSVTGLAGTGVVRSVALSPDGHEVLAVLDGLTFPGDVLATIDPTSQAITATVNLQTENDTMGALATDSTRDYVWVTDQTANDDVVQNLNLGVSDPASQPFATAVGGTSVSALGPAPTETTWNDQMHYAEGAGGGGISQTFTMPSFQQQLGTVSGSSGTPCGNTSGGCREIPDVSADADPSTGYVIYDSVNVSGGWTAIGGTSGAAPLWAAVLAVVSSANGNPTGYGDVNPILYQLAQQSPGTYLNDVTTGNNDLNGTGSQQFPAMSGYDMATGLGTPVTSALAAGLTAIPLDVAVSGSQVFGGSPTFTATPDFGGSGGTPFGVTVDSTGLVCTEVGTSTPITSSLPAGSNTLVASSCNGVTLGGTNASDYSLVLTSASGDFTVTPAPVPVDVSGSQTYGGSPTFSGSASPPAGITADTTGLTCTQVQPSAFITPGLAAGSYALSPGSCSGVVLSGTNASDYAPSYTSASNSFPVAQAPLTVTASSPSVTYGSTPAITPSYSGFVNGDTAAALTTQPTCSTSAASTSPVNGSPFASSCSGAVDPNYSITYSGGTVTVNPAPLVVTASSPSMTYGSTSPAITPIYSGFENGETSAVLTAQPICSSTATSTSTPSPPTYPSSCIDAAGSNYDIAYAPGAVTVTPAPVSISVLGSQAYGGSPSFTGIPIGTPAGVTVDASGLTCRQVAPSTTISPGLAGGSYTLVNSSCQGASLSGSDATNYAVVYQSTPGNFSVTGGPPPPAPVQHGYWLVGSDGGIFTFGSGHFFGSTGNLHLQRPVVGITPTADQGGYWLVASDGGIFAFGDAGFFGSIPGLGMSPPGSGLPHALNAPIVGMVPSADGGGYFMVASDGGVFAFGDAQFEGSCPGIGGCNGAAVSVVPDASGHGYWLVTKTGSVYTFGDAPYYGAPGPQATPITAAVRSADGAGYYVLLANGTVDGYGDAVPRGGPIGAVGGLDPASAIFTDVGGGGYWVASARGDVFTYGDAPSDGSMAGTALNGPIIAATGF